MLVWYDSISKMNFSALMEVYEEGNRETGRLNYPFESECMQLRLAENDFADYLREDFFRQDDAKYAVLEKNGEYVSALRLERYQDGYLITGLETKSSQRRKGYARELMEAILRDISVADRTWIYSHVSKSNTASMNLHKGLGFEKVHDYAVYLDGSVSTSAVTLRKKR